MDEFEKLLKAERMYLLNVQTGLKTQLKNSLRVT